MESEKLSITPENLNPKQRLNNLYEQGIQKIEDYTKSHNESEYESGIVPSTAKDFEKLFEEIKEIIEETAGPLSKEQKEQLNKIRRKGVQKISDYAKYDDQGARSTAEHFRKLFEEIEHIIES